MVCDAGEIVSSVLLTRNAAAAAPIRVCRENLDGGAVRGIAANSGNANAATGEQGLKDALEMQSAAADALGLDDREVLVAETGVIGVPLEIDRVTEGVRKAAGSLARDRATGFTRAIMTTDRAPKNLSVKAGGVTITAQAKGAGMIQPGFATMLCFVQTDAQVSDPDAALRQAVDGSFERITVDGQMSTNDTVVLQATGETETPMPAGILDSVLLALALEIVADGEGAERIGRAKVTEARGRRRGRAGCPRDRELTAGEDRADGPRRQLGSHSPGRRNGPRRRGDAGARPAFHLIQGARRRDATRPRSVLPSAAATRAPTFTSPTSPTSTSTSTPSTRHESRAPH